ncbi:MAG TPA: hypothetical protein H9681_08320 [Firmicutes bacterium]|nr:hypothetical protein [Bacillota bacterium]
MYNYSKYLSRFDNYRWQLRALSAKETEYRKINSDINSGVTARDVFDPDWKKTLQSEIEALKAELAKTEHLLTLFPDTSEYIQCRLFLRLHYIIGCSMTETASEMDVSLTTLRRIRDRCVDFFDKLDS